MTVVVYDSYFAISEIRLGDFTRVIIYLVDEFDFSFWYVIENQLENIIVCHVIARYIQQHSTWQ